jgi:hypothetical protein
MKTIIKNSNIALRYALLTTLGLILYFVLMRIIGLGSNTDLRVLNFLILFFGVYKSIAAFKYTLGSGFTYFRGLLMGVKTVLLTAIFFIIVILIYYSFDPSFIDTILNQGKISGAQSIYGIVGAIFVEAVGSGFIMAFMCMQYLKTPMHVVPEQV